jgi:DNA modification methylase
MTYKLILGDCLEYMRTMPDKSVDAVITDPPYGMNWNAKVTCGKNGHGTKGQKYSNYGKTIQNDNIEFNPLPFLEFEKVILWGSNHYSNKLSKGTTLVWIKKHVKNFGKYLSNAEIAWMKGGEGVYCYFDTSLLGDTNNRLHTNQKPIGLMRWCIEKISARGDTIFDPFMGSGTTGVAAIQLGRNFIGIDIDPDYFNIAEKRIREATLQPNLFPSRIGNSDTQEQLI